MAASRLDAASLVLVVDDEPVVRRLLERTLRDAGYVVQAAPGALSALDLLSTLNTPPAVVVTDLRMDPMDGASLARIIRERWPGTPVLFVTGCASTGLDGDLPDLPGPVLMKPFKPEQLAEAVSSLFPDSSAERKSS